MAVFAVALPAQARFGKAGSSSSSSSSSSRPSSAHAATSPPSSTHAAVPVRSSGGDPTGRDLSTRYVPYGYSGNPWRYGYTSAWFVPPYGYGYYYAPPLAGQTPAPDDGAFLRVTAGLEAMTYVRGETGVTVGAVMRVEGARWGILVSGQNIAVRSLDGPGLDLLQQAQVRLTYAFLSGRYGRLGVELGGDAIFAPSLTTIGPSAALSGTLWIGGPFALEGLVLVTPLPFWQLDYRAGLAVGLGPVGLRAGWRTQVLDDRGLTNDGLVHRDVFMGPYVGASIVF